MMPRGDGGLRRAKIGLDVCDALLVRARADGAQRPGFLSSTQQSITRG
jgi:hypothetical protein